MPAGPRVVVIGDVMNDILVVPEGPLVVGSDRRAVIRTLPGGSGANQAAWLAHFGVAVRLAARVGACDRARLSAEFAAAGVEAWLGADEEAPTGTLVTMVSAEGERSFFTDRGANDGLSAADLPESLLDDAGFVEVSAYALVAPGSRAAVSGFLRAARGRGVAFSVDPASASFLEEIGPRNFLDWTRGAAICFANRQEAQVLTGKTDPDAQFRALLGFYRRVVVKRGADGAEMRDAGGSWEARPPAVPVVDTTGAGDAFLAAFLAAHLQGAAPGHALRRAVEAGALATRRLGGRPPP